MDCLFSCEVYLLLKAESHYRQRSEWCRKSWAISHEELCPTGYNLKWISLPLETCSGHRRLTSLETLPHVLKSKNSSWKDALAFELHLHLCLQCWQQVWKLGHTLILKQHRLPYTHYNIFRGCTFSQGCLKPPWMSAKWIPTATLQCHQHSCPSPKCFPNAYPASSKNYPQITEAKEESLNNQGYQKALREALSCPQFSGPKNQWLWGFWRAITQLEPASR